MCVWAVGPIPRSILETIKMLWVLGFYDPKEMVYLGLSAEIEPELRIVAPDRCGIQAESHQTLPRVLKERKGSELKLDLQIRAILAIDTAICVE